MKIQVRKSVFETNSSTCHTIAIPKRPAVLDVVETYDVKRWWGEGYCFNRGLLEMVERVGDKIAFAFMLILYKLCRRTTDKKYGGEGLEHKDVKPDIDLWKSRILEWTGELAVEEDKENILDHIKDLLDFLEATIFSQPQPTEVDDFGNNAYIDHPEELYKFVDSIEKDPELLKKFIFDPEAYATVCGDEYRGAYVKKVGFDEDYPCSWNKEDGEVTFGDRIRELEKDWDFWMSYDPE